MTRFASRRRKAVALVVAAVAVAAGGACGVGEGRLHERRPDEVPFGLLRPDPTTTTTAAAPAGERVAVFLVDADRLVPVFRDLPAPVGLTDVVGVLALGPTSAEAAAGLRTALTPGEVVRAVTVTGGIATVDLASSFTTIPPADQVIGLAQIVYTLTGRPGIGRAAFTLLGEPVEIPRGDGSLTGTSVARDDYGLLAAA